MGRIVRALKSGQEEDLGSGFGVIDARTAVTANHVVRDVPVADLRYAPDDERRITVERVQAAEHEDVVVLHLTDDLDATEVLELSQASERERWLVDTQPRPGDPALTGTITAWRRRIQNEDEHTVSAIQLDVDQLLAEYEGYSGSPVVLESRPRAVFGVLVEQVRLRAAPVAGQRQPAASNVLYAMHLDSVLVGLGVLDQLAAPATSRAISVDGPTGAKQALRNLLMSSSQLQRTYLKSTPDPQKAPPVTDLDEVVDALTQMAPTRRGVAPLIEFMERARRVVPAAAIDGWLAQAATPIALADLRAALDDEEQAAEGARELLLVEIRTNDDARKPVPAEPTEVEAWLLTANGWELHMLEACDAAQPGAAVDPTERVRTAFGTILAKAEQLAGPEMVIEFLVPRKLFCLAPERWEFGGAYEQAAAVGLTHPVVLRWRERLRDGENAKAGFWRSRAAKIKQRVAAGAMPEVLTIQRNEYDALTLRQRLQSERFADIVGLLFVPPSIPVDIRQDLVIALLVTGVPYAFWVEVEKDQVDDVHTSLTNLARATDLNRLPSTFQKLRNDAAAQPGHFASALSIVWDDPDHTPPTLRLAAPELRGVV